MENQLPLEKRETRGLVADAEREILDELLAISEGIDRASTAEEASEFRTSMVAAALVAACLFLTAWNVVGGADVAAETARQEQYAIEALELFAGDIEAYRQVTGSYPEVFENPFDDDNWRYERLSDQHFRLVVTQGDGELAYDSAAGVARRDLAGGAR
jgi:hypothetical protein